MKFAGVLVLFLVGCNGHPQDCVTLYREPEQIAGRAYTPPRVVLQCKDGVIVRQAEKTKD